MKRSGHRSFMSDQTGAAAVEFAMIAMPLILLTLGVVEVGRAIFTQQSLSYAVDHAVRRLYIDGNIDLNALETVIANESFLIDPGKLSVFRLAPATLPNGSTTIGVVELQVTYTFESIMAGWVLDMIPMSFNRTIVVAPGP